MSLKPEALKYLAPEFEGRFKKPVAEVAENPSVEVPQALKLQKLFNFDVEEYPFADLIREAFLMKPYNPSYRVDEGTPLDEFEGSLSKIHLTAEGRRSIENPPRSKKQGDAFRKRWQAALNRKNFEARIKKVIRSFVQQVAAGELGVPTSALIYQAEPSLRVNLPQAKPVGLCHTDSDYNHQPGEINFWIPVMEDCGVFDSNSLLSESSPGVGDFTSFRTSKYGEGVRFYGNKCRHYTVKNETEVTRVSIDIRVVPDTLFVPEWKNA
mmetsp:Transcript_23393/g.36607  ORF Transcript_23393/g.36607 Transcript_23393/m.36607 type:complete len:267 (+) Transcript_23393:140-940(+)